MSSLTQPKKKIFVFALASHGHLNPIASVCSELVKQNMDVIFYGIPQYETLIRKTGATYRPYNHYPESLILRRSVNDTSFLRKFITMLYMVDQVTPDIVKDIERDKPDAILYEKPLYHIKYALDILASRQHANKTKQPKVIEISTMFSIKKGIYPSHEEFNKMIQVKKDIWTFLYIITLMLLSVYLSFKYHVKMFNPLNFNNFQSDLVITTVFPEFQPMREKFNSPKYKYVGCCIEENVRTIKIKDPNYNRIIQLYDPINPLGSLDGPRNNRRLIYASLGTIDNMDSFIFYKIIDAGKQLINRCGTKFKIHIIMSLGDEVYREIRRKIENKEYHVPEENFALMKFVPQIEILKRASLFVSHVGMNSMSETVHYGVPVLGK